MMAWLQALIALLSSNTVTSMLAGLGTLVTGLLQDLFGPAADQMATDIFTSFERITSSVTTDIDLALEAMMGWYQALVTDFGGGTPPAAPKALAPHMAVDVSSVTPAQMSAISAMVLAKIEKDHPGTMQRIQAMNIGISDVKGPKGETMTSSMASRGVEIGLANSRTKTQLAKFAAKP